jgi:hypothetical protein
MSEMKLIDSSIPGMNCEGEERHYDLWHCWRCGYKFVVGKKNATVSTTT